MPADYSGGTFANGSSGDGSTVVGYAWISETATRPFRWTAAGGYQDLGNLGVDSSNGRAYDASFDGSAVVGQSSTTVGPSASGWQAVGGMQPLPIYQALATSDDGSVTVGMDIRWTAPGQVDHLRFLGGNNYTSAYGMSADGQLVTGYSETSPNRYAHAFSWTPAGGIRDLGVTNGTESLAWGVSPDGSVVYGEARDQAGYWRAFRWTSALGMRDMDTLGGPMSTAHAASADGAVIVGKVFDQQWFVVAAGVRWTPSTGMRDLRQELLDTGAAAVQNWTLAVAAGVSADGSVIAGWGYPAPLTPAQPFIAVLPVPGGGGAALSSVSLSSSSVRGGRSVTGTVRLTAARARRRRRGVPGQQRHRGGRGAFDGDGAGRGHQRDLHGVHQLGVVGPHGDDLGELRGGHQDHHADRQTPMITDGETVERALSQRRQTCWPAEPGSASHRGARWDGFTDQPGRPVTAAGSGRREAGCPPSPHRQPPATGSWAGSSAGV